MKKAHKNKEGNWICGCSSGYSAMYNIKNKLNCEPEDRVCAWCFKK